MMKEAKKEGGKGVSYDSVGDFQFPNDEISECLLPRVFDNKRSVHCSVLGGPVSVDLHLCKRE